LTTNSGGGNDGDTKWLCMCDLADPPKLLANWKYAWGISHRHHHPSQSTNGHQKYPLLDTQYLTLSRFKQSNHWPMSVCHQSKRNQKLLWQKSRNRPPPTSSYDDWLQDASMSIYQFMIAVRQQDGQQLMSETGETTSYHLVSIQNADKVTWWVCFIGLYESSTTGLNHATSLTAHPPHLKMERSIPRIRMGAVLIIVGKTVCETRGSDKGVWGSKGNRNRRGSR